MKDFIKAAANRAIRTVCQTALALIPAGITIAQVDWKTVIGSALLAGFISILSSVATGLPEVQTGVDVEDKKAL